MLNAAGYGGAATVVLELTEEFRAMGAQVDICAWWMANPMAKHFQEAGAKRLDDIHSTNPFDYDIVFFLHHSAPLHFRNILGGAKQKTAILFLRLSHSSNIGVPSPIIEEMIADLWFVNSNEVRDRMIGQFGLPEQLIDVFNNAAPQAFFDRARLDSKPLEKVVYVSNHCNQQVVETLRLLRDKYDLKTIHYGHGGDFQVRITPNEIASADVVITMAKTSQFALAARVPVYIYDYLWGGPGYLSDKNYDLAEANNFSGSGSIRILEPEQIATEIVQGYGEASAFAKGLSASRLERISLKRVVSRIRELLVHSRENKERVEKLLENRALVNREIAYTETSRQYFRTSREQHRRRHHHVNHQIVIAHVQQGEQRYAQAILVEDQQTAFNSEPFGKDSEMLGFIQQLELKGSYIDVGASFGYHSLFFANCCHSATVYAFEPFEKPFEILEINSRLAFDRTKILPKRVAIADRTGMCSMQTFRIDDGIQTKRVPGADTQVCRLDELLIEVSDIKVIKIEVDGDEAAVLNGADHILKRHKPDLFVHITSTGALGIIQRYLLPLGYQSSAQFHSNQFYHFSAR